MIAVRKIKQFIEEGAKGEMGVITSEPVLREENGTLYIAFFVLTVLENGNDKLADKRQLSCCCITDLEAGGIKEAVPFNTTNFPDSNLATIFKTEELGDISEEKRDELYALIDGSRQSFLEMGANENFRKEHAEIFQREYAEYFRRLMAAVPDALKPVYRYFSRIPDLKEERNMTELPGRPEHAGEEDRPSASIPGSPENTPEERAEQRSEKEQIEPVREQAARPAPEPERGSNPERAAGAAGEAEKTAAAKNEPGTAEAPAAPKKQEEKKEGKKAEKEIPAIDTDQSEAYIREIDWTPQVNLSLLPERHFRAMNRIAEQVRFLNCEVPGKLKYEFPLYCFSRDGEGVKDPWIELAYLLRNGNLQKGRFRTTPRDTIYSICPKGKENNCLFGKCPYMVAAYIRYLKATNPQELKRQRNDYRENRFTRDVRYLGEPGYEIRLPERMDPQKLARGLAIADSGLFSAMRDDGASVRVLWLEDLGPKGYQIMERILPCQELSSGRPSPESWRDRNGSGLPGNIAYAVLADYLDRKGLFESTMQNLKGRAQAEAAQAEAGEAAAGTDKKKSDITAEAAPAGKKKEEKTENRGSGTKEDRKANREAEPSARKPEQARQEAAPERQPEKEAPKAGDAKEAEKNKSGSSASALAEYADPSSKAYRCVMSPDAKTFYGSIIHDGDPRKSMAFRALTKALKEKGFTGAKLLPAAMLAEEDRKKAGTLFAVTGFDWLLRKEDKGEEEKGKRDETIKALHTFLPESGTILLLSEEESRALFALDPSLQQIYGTCTLREQAPSTDALYERFLKCLPEELKKKVDANTKPGFERWYDKNWNRLPATEETLADYLAWRCTINGNIRFSEI